MKQLKNWDNKTWLSSNKYILSFYKFLKTKIKINKKTTILDIGCGRANIIICSYNPLVWEEEMQLEKQFFTSGLGGIFPRGLVVGTIVNIIDIDPTRKDLEIKLVADPIESNLLGVLSN